MQVWTGVVFAGMIVSLGARMAGAAPEQAGALAMHPVDHARWHFEGELGRRVEANAAHWLKRMPGANPGLIEMFHRRDRHLPYAEPVPWAGEFAGKYLISAVQACRMTSDPELHAMVAQFVEELIACQDGDGYLGPWKKEERLLGHWDLWGHYHCMLGLLMWYEDQGDAAALACARRAADFAVSVFGSGERRPIDAGTPQINLAFMHVLARLYRMTGEVSYLDLAKRFEEDMEKDGDWLRKGAEGVPYYQLPGGGTRWESLHIVQAFTEMYRITGEERYKSALLNLWESIRRFDRHPSGAFSTNEQAFGTVYASGSIETCCSVAWMALCIDALCLSGDATAADELELTLWNEALAALHPSGSWCTYDTPLNGVRAPSYHQINFQYRPGSPELNCCSVNAPRMLGMLSEWAVLEDAEGLVVNFYGPYEAELEVGDTPVRVTQKTEFPVDGRLIIQVAPEKKQAFVVKVRIPGWSRENTVAVNGAWDGETPQPGTYLSIAREWEKGDTIALSFDMGTRYWAGEGPERGGRMALYRGPLLLAADAYNNEVEIADLAPISAENLDLRPVNVVPRTGLTPNPPMGLWEIATDSGAAVRLCDFASSGAQGTEYAAWLPASHLPPPQVTLLLPEKDTEGCPGPMLFQWSPTGDENVTADLIVARDTAFEDVVLRQEGLHVSQVALAEGFPEAGAYFWKVCTRNASGAVENHGGPGRFVVDAASAAAFVAIREDGLMAASALAGNGTPAFGRLEKAKGLSPTPGVHGEENGAVRFDGNSALRYALPYFPEDGYSFQAWICPEDVSGDGLQQVFSAWCNGGDDPLRVCMQGEKLFARIEGGGFHGTPGVDVKQGAWAYVAAVKAGDRLTLFVDGEARASAPVPVWVHSRSRAVGIGYNPLFGGGEHYIGRIAAFEFFARALSEEEIRASWKAGQGA